MSADPRHTRHGASRCYVVPRHRWPCVFRALMDEDASFTTGRTTGDENGAAIEVLAGASAEVVLEDFGLEPIGRPRVDPWERIIKGGEFGHLPGPRNDDPFEVAFQRYAAELERVNELMIGGES